MSIKRWQVYLWVKKENVKNVTIAPSLQLYTYKQPSPAQPQYPQEESKAQSQLSSLVCLAC